MEERVNERERKRTERTLEEKRYERKENGNSWEAGQRKE